MIAESEESRKSRINEVRKFGITIGVILGLWGWFFLYRDRWQHPYFFVFSAAFLFCAFAAPAVLEPVQKAWMGFAAFLSRIMTKLILGLLFFLIITPIGVLARLFGKKFLAAGNRDTHDSYWIPRETSGLRKESYERQF